MAGALNHSCNLYFIQVAEKMSAEFFYNYYQAFGLTQTTGIDLPYEAKGISKTQQEMEQVETDLYSVRPVPKADPDPDGSRRGFHRERRLPDDPLCGG